MMQKCVHCNRPTRVPGDASTKRPVVCNGCSESIRTTHLALTPLGLEAVDAPVKPKRKRKSRSGAATVAVGFLLLLAVSLTACTVAWSGSISLQVDPAPLLQLQRPVELTPPQITLTDESRTLVLDPDSQKPAVEISTAKKDPTSWHS